MKHLEFAKVYEQLESASKLTRSTPLPDRNLYINIANADIDSVAEEK